MTIEAINFCSNPCPTCPVRNLGAKAEAVVNSLMQQEEPVYLEDAINIPVVSEAFRANGAEWGSAKTVGAVAEAVRTILSGKCAIQVKLTQGEN